MAVPYLASTTVNTIISVEVRAIGRPFESVNQPGRYFLNVADATDSMFVTGTDELGARLMKLKRGQAYNLVNVLVEENVDSLKNRFPFNDTRLVITPDTLIKELPKNLPGLPPATDGSVKSVEFMATRIISMETEGPYKYVKLAATDGQDEEWSIKMHGPFYRQWIRSVAPENLPIKIAFRGVEKDGQELRLLPRSDLKIIGSAPSSPLNTSAASNEEPISASDSDSKKRKRDASSESGESDDEDRRSVKKLKTEEKPLVSCNAVTPVSSDDAQDEAKLRVAMPELTWQVGEDQVLVITSKEHFDRMARAQQTTLVATERSVPLWKRVAQVGFFAAVAALGGLYFVTPDKIVVFLSMANFFKIIV